MSCTHYETCPLFKYFSSHPVLNLWRIHYCDKADNSHCMRYKQTSRGLPNPVSLLPNGKNVEIAPLALINAAKNNRIHLINNILQNIDIDLNFQNIDGMTALMVAAQKGNTKIVETILQHRVDTEIRNYKDETAYDIALSSQQKETATLLRQYSHNNTTFSEVFSE